MAKPTKQTKEDEREEREEEEREMRAEEEREASAKPAKAPAAKPMSDEPPADRTAIWRDPKATTLQETPEPGPIDPDWVKPEPTPLSSRDVHTKGKPRPGSDSEVHGTECPPRLFAVGGVEPVSSLLGKPATPEQTGPFRKKPAA